MDNDKQTQLGVIRTVDGKRVVLARGDRLDLVEAGNRLGCKNSVLVAVTERATLEKAATKAYPTEVRHEGMPCKAHPS